MLSKSWRPLNECCSVVPGEDQSCAGQEELQSVWGINSTRSGELPLISKVTVVVLLLQTSVAALCVFNG